MRAALWLIALAACDEPSAPQPRATPYSGRLPPGTVRSAPRAAPGLTIGTPRMLAQEGVELSPWRVATVVTKHDAALAGCMAASGANHVTITLGIDGPTGAVTSVAVDVASAGALHDCLDVAFRAMRFADGDVGETRVELELTNGPA